MNCTHGVSVRVKCANDLLGHFVLESFFDQEFQSRITDDGIDYSEGGVSTGQATCNP